MSNRVLANYRKKMVEHVSITVINEKLVSIFINTQKEEHLFLHKYVEYYTLKSDVFPYYITSYTCISLFYRVTDYYLTLQ